MTTVEEDIRFLIQIVKKDIEIQKIKKFLEEAPAHIAEINKKIKGMEDELRESQNAFDKLEKERRHLEREIESQNDKITQKRIEQDAAKTNKVFRALGNEIEYLMKQVDKEEERILTILEAAEARKKEVDASTGKLNEVKDSLSSRGRELEEGMRKSREALKIMEDEKVRILPHLSDRIRRLYNRILGVKGDSGVANLVGDICHGCYSRVPPQRAHEIRKNNQIMTCEVCGRILVYFQAD